MSEFYPITLVRFKGDSFGEYLREILVAEGFPYVRIVGDPFELDADRNPLVILPSGKIESKAADCIISMVDEGVTLFTIKPSVNLRGKLGIEVRGEFDEGYISWADSRPVQFHSSADLFVKDGWEVLASLRDGDGENLGSAVLTMSQGQGRITIFSFDLPKSIALTRQGNPEWIDSKGDEWLGGIRPGDLFCRITGESWLDMGNADLPQADLMQRFFVDILASQSGFPLPRTWYFPRMEKTSVTIVADSDSATPSEVETETELVKSHGGVYSLYLIDKTLDLISSNEISEFLDLGNEASIHPDYNRVGDPLNPEKGKMRDLYREMVGRFEYKFGFRPATMRHHSIVWCGWVDVPRVEAEFGISLDDCYGYAPWLGQEKYGGPEVGYITGSGQPQRFCDLNGELVDVYQLEQNLEDEILLPEKGMNLGGEEAANRLTDFVEASVGGHYSHVVACFHPITVSTSPEAYRALDGFLATCRRRSYPIRTLRDVSEYADLRRKMSFERFDREDDTLSFELSGPFEAITRGMSIIVPAHGIDGIEVDGRGVQWKMTRLWGREYLYDVPSHLPSAVEVQWRY
jgi:hypothetical protein